MAAIDDSGDLEYLSIIIGETDKMENLAKTLPSSFTHMTDLDRKTKKKILSGLNFNGNMKICCIKFGYPDLRDAYKNKSKDVENRKYNQKFYYNLAIEIKIKLQLLFKDFLIRNNLCLENIVFEVDNDIVRDILKYNGIKFIRPGGLHKIADCIAHANYKHLKVNGINEYNNDQFKDELRNRFLKRCFRRSDRMC